MSLREALRIALRALRTHRLRSGLTILGIVIGVSAVILLVAIGNGVQSSVKAQVDPLANLITVKKSEGNTPDGGAPKELRDADLAALQKRAVNVASVIPVTSGQVLVEAQTAKSSVIVGRPTVKSRSNVTGSTERWIEVNNLDLTAGSFFNETQVRSTGRVVVLGTTVATNLFGKDPHIAINKTVRVKHQLFKVIGVLRSIGEPGDSITVMPISSARRYVYGGIDKVDVLLVQATRADAVPAAVDEIINVLSDRHRIRDPTERDFEVQSLRGQLEAFQQILRILALFTVSIAAISLIVGSVGVLNIMLVSVTERTREIGIRKAIGASRRAILNQFLIESVALAGFGGLIGILVGIGLSLLSAIVVPSYGVLFRSFTPEIDIRSVVVAFTVSLLIGVIAGGYPSYRAARLRPVEALRYQ